MKSRWNDAMFICRRHTKTTLGLVLTLSLVSGCTPGVVRRDALEAGAPRGWVSFVIKSRSPRRNASITIEQPGNKTFQEVLGRLTTADSAWEVGGLNEHQQIVTTAPPGDNEFKLCWNLTCVKPPLIVNVEKGMTSRVTVYIRWLSDVLSSIQSADIQWTMEKHAGPEPDLVGN